MHHEEVGMNASQKGGICFRGANYMPVNMIPTQVAMVAGVTHVVSPNEVTACSNTYSLSEEL